MDNEEIDQHSRKPQFSSNIHTYTRLFRIQIVIIHTPHYFKKKIQYKCIHSINRMFHLKLDKHDKYNRVDDIRRIIFVE